MWEKEGTASRCYDIQSYFVPASGDLPRGTDQPRGAQPAEMPSGIESISDQRTSELQRRPPSREPPLWTPTGLKYKL